VGVTRLVAGVMWRTRRSCTERMWLRWTSFYRSRPGVGLCPVSSDVCLNLTLAVVLRVGRVKCSTAVVGDAEPRFSAMRGGSRAAK
jgi:hypothetical protein